MTDYPNKTIYNIDREDFEVTYDLKGDKQPITYKIFGREYGTFPEPVADHIAKHLADKIIHKRGVKTNYEDEYKIILKEIYG